MNDLWKHANTARPTCAVCNRPVEKLAVSYNNNWNTATYTVECHGAVEQATLTDRQIHEAQMIGGISFGLAFQASEAPALPAADSRTAASLSSSDAA